MIKLIKALVFVSALASPAYAQQAPQPPANPIQVALAQLGAEHAYEVATIAQLQAQITQLEHENETLQAQLRKKPNPQQTH